MLSTLSTTIMFAKVLRYTRLSLAGCRPLCLAWTPRSGLSLSRGPAAGAPRSSSFYLTCSHSPQVTGPGAGKGGRKGGPPGVEEVSRTACGLASPSQFFVPQQFIILFLPFRGTASHLLCC